jgi:hypothetical protein
MNMNYLALSSLYKVSGETRRRRRRRRRSSIDFLAIELCHSRWTVSGKGGQSVSPIEEECGQQFVQGK